MKRLNPDLSPALSLVGRSWGRGLFWLLLALLGCSGQQLAVIEGRLPDARYDGEVVYLVPLKNATAANVDSTRIRQAAFRFERSAGEGEAEVFILRTRPLLRLRLQELLIILEPGRLAVALDSVSSARGTALNDSLQQWKERKQRYDALKAALRDPAAKEEAGREYARDNYQFVLRNRANAAGRFVYELSRPLFTPEQRQMFQMPD
jgi:hypothetical protein